MVKKNDFIGFRISESMKEKLEMEAKQADISVSALLQKIVAHYLNGKETKMDRKDLIKLAMKNIIRDYDNIPDLEKKNVVENIQKPLLDAAGSWVFLFQYIPDELAGPEDELSLEEIAIIRAAQLYFYHRHVSREEVHVNSNECYFKPIDIYLRSQPQNKNYAIRRLWSFVVGFSVDEIVNNLLYFIDLLKGDFKADYMKLAIDLLNVETEGRFPIDLREWD